jgi:CelD/BcsL family acetyltransferase involved in cellulose biosynthesis
MRYFRRQGRGCPSFAHDPRSTRLIDSASAGSLRLEPIEQLGDVREEWRRLAQVTGHPFSTWEWNELSWRHFGAGRELYSFACRDSAGEVAAILPLYVAASRPLRVARFLGYADLQSPVCAPANRPLAARGMREAMSRSGGCPLIFAERLPCEAGWSELLGGRLMARQTNPVLRLAGMSWEEYVASKSANFRGQVRRKERRAREEKGLSFRLTHDASRLQADFDALARLHTMRWGQESTGSFRGERAAFHREFAAVALEQGWLRLWLAEIDGEPVAAWYGWRFAGDEFYFQAGRDTRFDDYSVGFVLMVHTLREACRDGVNNYHFMAGGEAYKWRFTSDDFRSETRLLGSRPIVGLASVAFKAAFSLPASARQRVMRAGPAGRSR